jgi:hypothetical protein
VQPDVLAQLEMALSQVNGLQQPAAPHVEAVWQPCVQKLLPAGSTMQS